MRRKLSYLPMGTEVITKDLRIAVVDAHYSNERVHVRYHYDNWPFPEWDVLPRCQLTEIPVQYEDAPF